MPDHQPIYCQSGRTSELEKFTSEYNNNMRTRNSLVKKENFPSAGIDTFNHLSSPDAKGCHTDRGYNADIGDSMFQAGQSPKKSRAKESSKHFGVRFRPDLQKWVAEIRVAEWKTVDKKVWLGTFDSEEGAARAVDAARKLLKCKKKRNPNFQCESLAKYSERLPSNLHLANLRDDSMFKEVTLFVKRKAQEYAASFCPKPSCIAIGSENMHAKLCNSREPPQEFGLIEDEMSMAGYGTSYETQFSVTTGDSHWNNMSPTVTYFGSTPSCSSAGTSPEDQWQYIDHCSRQQINEQAVDEDWVKIRSASSHVGMGGVDHEMDLVWEGQNMGNDGQYVLPDNDQWLSDVNDLLFPIDDECFGVETPMDIVPRDEMIYVDNQNQSFSIVDPSLADWMSPLPQQNFYTYNHSLTGSMEYSTQVC